MDGSKKIYKNTAAGSAITILSPQVAFGTKANSAIRIGIIGCGNRGYAVLPSIVNDTNTHIIAMADLFEDKLLESKGKFDSLNTAKGGSEIEKSKMFMGSKSYLKLRANCVAFMPIGQRIQNLCTELNYFGRN